MTEPSPFAVLEDTFQLLGAEPAPLAVDGQQLGHGLPCRQIPIAEVRALLTRPTASSELHDQGIEAVLGRMRQQRAAWVVALSGLVLPGLRCLAEQMTTSHDQRLPLDVEAALLSRLLAATRRPPPAAHRLARHLLQLAQASHARTCEAARIARPDDHGG
jgi:hypothetical protein